MIYFDEAGNSGSNLLDIDQPTYLLLSHDYSTEESIKILHPLFSVTKAEELHFNRLKKFARSRRAIIECINDPGIVTDRTFAFVCHKEVLIIAQLVDQLVEIVLYEHGIDIYKGGLNISTTNMIYLLGKNVWNRELFRQMCQRFVQWMRSGTPEDADLFYQRAATLYESIEDERQKLFVGFILFSRFYQGRVMAARTKYTIDVTLSTFVAHCNFWADKYQQPFDIILDASKQIDYYREYIDFLTKNLPAQEVGYGSRKHKYPLLINSLSLENSHSHIPIQLADIFASSLNYVYSNVAKEKSDDFSEEIRKSRLFSINQNSIWPSTDITPEALDMTDENGINPLDYLAEHMNTKNE